MRRTFIIISILFLSTVSLFAQDYKTGIGLRGAFGGGVTIKHFLDSRTAIEGLVESRWRGLNITGLYEIHQNAFDVDKLNWYYGVGGHVGFWNGDASPWFNNDGSHSVIGIDGIVGIEYTFDEAPINIGIDWKPAFNIIGATSFWGDGGGISIRYVF